MSCYLNPYKPIAVYITCCKGQNSICVVALLSEFLFCSIVELSSFHAMETDLNIESSSWVDYDALQLDSSVVGKHILPICAT